MDDIPSEITEALGLVVPRADVVQQIYERAAEMAALDYEIYEKEEEVRRMKDDLRMLATKIIPELFDNVQTDKFGVPGWSADVVLESIVKANIAADWDDDRQQAGFDELERVGGGDLVKAKVSVSFGREELGLAQELYAYISRWNRLEDREIVMDKTVPWNTLTKFVKDLIARRRPFDQEKLGATILRQCKIVWRKTRSGQTVRERQYTVSVGEK